MNWLQDWLDKIQSASQESTIPTKQFIRHLDGKANDRQISKIQKLVSDYDSFIKLNHDRFEEEDFISEFDEVTNEFISSIKKIKNRQHENHKQADRNCAGRFRRKQ